MYSQTHLNKVARQLNERPRKTLHSKPQQRDLTPVFIDRLSRQGIADIAGPAACPTLSRLT